MLLDNDMLVFKRDQLISGEPVKRESVTSIQDKYLNYSFDKPLYILRIIDSKNEKFKLSKLYIDRFGSSIINVQTCPEIEILLIISSDNYSKYTNQFKSKMKPSEYCKQVLGMKNVKQKSCFESVFADINKLKEAINKYARYTKKSFKFYTLNDLLK
jgi:hypothetical protein